DVVARGLVGGREGGVVFGERAAGGGEIAAADMQLDAVVGDAFTGQQTDGGERRCAEQPSLHDAPWCCRLRRRGRTSAPTPPCPSRSASYARQVRVKGSAQQAARGARPGTLSPLLVANSYRLPLRVCGAGRSVRRRCAAGVRPSRLGAPV